MPTLFRMPAVAAQTTEAILAEWQVAENVPYQQEDAVVTVETDKATVDVEAETGGVILKYLVSPGTEVAVGAPIAIMGRPGETITDLEAVLRELGVAGQAPNEAGPTRPGYDAPGPSTPAYQSANGKRLFATPLVRRLAAEAGLDLNQITGSGPGGRIVRRDIEPVLDRGSAPAAEPATAAAPPTAPPKAAAVPPNSADYRDEPHSRIRKAIAARLAESKQTAPHFYMSGTCRVDRLVELRKQINDTAEAKVSINDMVVKAAARAHVLIPAMNVIWTDDSIRLFDAVDIAVAVASDRGLLTPVVRNVAQRSVTAIAADLRELAERARDGKLAQHELEGGALSISNLGMYGTEQFAAIINPPQSAILGVGSARQEPIVVDGELAVGTVMRVTLSVDHRPIDGATAAEWLRTFIGIVENPLEILL